MSEPRTRADRALAGPSTVNAALAPVDPAQLAPSPGAVAPLQAQPVTTDDGRAVLATAGGFVSVPQSELSLALTEPGTRLARPDEWQKHKVERETSAFEAGAKEALAQGASTIAMAARVPAMVANLAGSEEAGDFLRDTSAAGFRAGLSSLGAALSGDGAKAATEYDVSLARQRIEEELFPTARAVGSGVGEVLGGLAFAPVAGLGAAKSALGVAGRAALGGAAEGAVSGASSEYQSSLIENRAIDRDLVVSSGLMGAALGGVLGGVTGYGGAKLSEVFGAGRTGKAATGQVDDLAAAGKRVERAAFETLDEADRPAARVAQELSEAEARVAQAARDAGPNPLAQEQAALAAAEREAENVRAIAGGEFDPKQWRKAGTPEVSPMATFVHRNTILGGSADEGAESLNRILKGTREMTEPISRARLKPELVASRFATDKIDETLALGASQARGRDFIDAITGAETELNRIGRGASKRAASTLQQMRTMAADAARVIDNTKKAPDAYIALDTLRHDQLLLRNALDGAKRSTDVQERVAAETLFPVVEREYLKTVDALTDEQVWGSQAITQRTVNGREGFVGVINSDRVGLKNFTDVTDYEYNRPILSADPDKLRAYLSKIDQNSLRDQQIANIVGKRVSMAKAIIEGYDLDATAKAAIQRDVIDEGEKFLKLLDSAESIAVKVNKQAKINEADVIAAQGGLGTRLFSAGLKLLSGEVRGAGAMFAGGQANVARQLQALQIQAQGEGSRLRSAMVDLLERAIQGAPEAQASAKALSKVRAKAERAGLISKAAETASAKLRDRGFVAAPLFRPEQDRDSQRKAYPARRDALAEVITNPAKAAAGLQRAASNMLAANPAMGTDAIRDMQQRLTRLQEALPGKRTPGVIPAAQKDQVSDQDLRQAEAYISATLDPQSVFTDFKSGNLDYDKLKFARAQYPKLFEVARATMLDLFRALEGDIDPNMATQLDYLLDFQGALDATLRPDFLKRSNERLEQSQQQHQQPQQKRAPKPQGQTYTQRIMGA